MLVTTPEYYTSFPQYPEYSVVISLWSNVENSAELLNGLLAQNPEYEYAFINAANIVSQEQLLAAVYRAIHDVENGIKRSRNVHSEVVLSLSHNNNLIEELKKFGIDGTTTSLYAIKVVKDSQGEARLMKIRTSFDFLAKNVKGKIVQLTGPNIKTFADNELVPKNYKTQDIEGIIGGMVLRGYN